MNKLILLRHAKSSWADPGLDDHDRPLNGRGRSAAPVIADWLAHRGHKPDVILSSSSARTRETVARMREKVASLPEPLVERILYHATPGEMLDRLNALPDRVNCALLVGHQPGLGSLVRKLADGHENRRCRRAFEHFPTAAAAVLEVPFASWQMLEFNSARFVDFAKPRELMDA
ncbi:MAG: histidine phosphatase family protein [Pseudomonadota bacterium]